MLRHDLKYEIGNDKYYELAREIWEFEYVCAKGVRIQLRNTSRKETYNISATVYTEREVLQMLKEYEFEYETEYDMVDVKTWKRKREDKRYILTKKRLLAIYVLIIKNTRYLSLQNLIDITQDLILEFFDENVRYRKTHLKFLSKVLKILESKEEDLE